MKKLLSLLLTSMLLYGCSIDESGILGRLDDLEDRVSKLEELCKQMNTNISSLQTIVAALQNNDYITSVTPITENGEEIGYTITFAKSNPITIYHGQDGKDGYTPVIGIRQDTDGIYYWTLDGKWLLDENGNKIKALGITPQLKIEEGYWYISYDEGKTWIVAGKATGEDGDSFIKEINEDDNYVYFLLIDGAEIKVPKAAPLSIKFDTEDLVVMMPNSERDIRYTIKSTSKEIAIEVLSSSDIKAKVISETDTTGKIHVETSDVIDEYSKVVVLVTDGVQVIMHTLTFEEEAIEVSPKNNLEAPDTGGNLTLYYLSNIECEVVIPEDATWIHLISTKALQEYEIILTLDPNDGVARSANVVVKSDSGASLTYTITQNANPNVQKQIEREALIAIYNALDGPNWANNTNWCSDKPLNEWYGILTNPDGEVAVIILDNNNLKGDLPDEIGVFTHLESLTLSSNLITGNIPEEIGNLKNLVYLNFYSNSLTGEIPESIYDLDKLTILGLGYNKLSGQIPNSIGNLINLQSLMLNGNQFSGVIPDEIGKLTNLVDLELSNSQFSGAVPESTGNLTELLSLGFCLNKLTSIPGTLANLTKLTQLLLYSNNFSGDIPQEILDSYIWRTLWPYFLNLTGFNTNGLTIYAPEFSNIHTLDGEILSDDIYKENKLTLILSCLTYADNEYIFNLLKGLYEKYNDKGLEILCYFKEGTKDEIQSIIDNYSIKWPCFIKDDPENDFVFYENTYPFVTVSDSSGIVVFNTMQNPYDSKLEALCHKYFNAAEHNFYESTDYSQDGKAVQLQEATKGNGIDIVLMGDAYSDRLISGGKYLTDIEEAIDALFSEEPYKSHKDYFNIHMVNVVSENEVYDEYTTTALLTFFEEGTLVGGNDDKVITYALNAISSDELDDAMIIVLMNQDAYAGTCYMFFPNATERNYGNGLSISYFPTNSDEYTFTGMMLHEAAGHGFAKLDDEYAYEYIGAAPEDYILDRQQQEKWGWWKNTDFTNDVNIVKWAHFLVDERYQYDGLGVFEGASTYWTGMWRPTENSIMRYNTGGFNAPSREAIYYRIHKLAYGEDWEYDYEDFVAYDEINRKTAEDAASAQARPQNVAPWRPTTPPVVVGKTWREAMEDAK